MSTLQLKRPRSLPLVLLCALALFATVACGGGGSDDNGGGGGGGGSGATALANNDVFLTDAPDDELLSFSGTLTDLRLDLLGGGSTENLIAGNVKVEFLSLENRLAWLASLDLDPGTYTAARMTFLGGSIEARRNDGALVPVNETNNVVVANFTTPLVINSSKYRRVVIDLDLEGSLEGSILTPPLTFTPAATVTNDDGTEVDTVDEFRGRLKSKNTGARRLVVDAFVDDDQTVALGPVTVVVDGGTLLVRDDGSEYSSISAFFSSIDVQSTALEIRGRVQKGVLTADRIEIEDNTVGGGLANQVKVEGMIINKGSSSFMLALGEVEKGTSNVSAVFLGAIPASILVTYDSTTNFINEDDDFVTGGELEIGQRVKVEFPQLSNPPFIAGKVEIEDQGAFEGRIVNVAGLPNTFVIHLQAFDPALLAGLVSTSITDVTVELGSDLALDTTGNPSLAPSQIIAGLGVEVEGVLSGTPNAPVIDASKTRIKAGRLKDAIVMTAVNGDPVVLSTSGGDIKDPFGMNISPGPMTVDAFSNCVWDGVVKSQANFFALFNNLSPGQSVVAEIRGLGTGAINHIRAYQIKTKVQNP